MVDADVAGRGDRVVATRELMTRSRLSADVRALDDALAGRAVMVHARISALGWVVGGAQTVVEALLDVVGPRGTILVLTGWDDRPPYDQRSWDETERDAYRTEAPAFDPRMARAERDHGRVPEAVRTWPGARHSCHPVCGFAALGADAGRLVSGQSLDEGYGRGSPLERLVDADGVVLLLGDLFAHVTVLHYAEYLAAVAGKRYVEYEMPVTVDGRRVWRRIRELDSDGALPYAQLGLDDDAFAVITRSALDAGLGRQGRVGAATGYVFAARPLVAFARTWMQQRFG